MRYTTLGAKVEGTKYNNRQLICAKEKTAFAITLRVMPEWTRRATRRDATRLRRDLKSDMVARVHATGSDGYMHAKSKVFINCMIYPFLKLCRHNKFFTDI